MKKSMLPLVVLALSLTAGKCLHAQAPTNNVPKDEGIIDNDKGNPLPIWEPPTMDIDETKAANVRFEMYPNPAKGKVTISYSARKEEQEIKIYSLIGNLLESRVLPAGNGSKELHLDLSSLPKGYYLLKLGGYSAKLSLL